MFANLKACLSLYRAKHTWSYKLDWIEDTGRILMNDPHGALLRQTMRETAGDIKSVMDTHVNLVRRLHAYYVDLHSV